MKASGFVCAKCCAEYEQRVEFCLSCCNSGVVIPNFQRPAALLMPVASAITARALAAQDQTTFRPSAYPALRLGMGSLIVIFGAPGQGKSTFALRFAESLTPAVFLALEEGAGPSLAAKLRRLEIRTDKLLIEEPRDVGRIAQIAARHGLRCIAVDSGSVCSLLPEDWLTLARKHGITVLATLQVRKDGAHAGSNRWIHDADVVLECEGMRWMCEKSRFQDTSGLNGEVL